MSSEGEQLAEFVAAAGSVVALTGAGVSTASGIPDYRDRDGNWKHPQPVQYADFIGSEERRRRYWSRSYLGWPRMGGASPNAAHQALAALEDDGRVELLVTQNVDGLHTAAGSARVVDLHGRVDSVFCLDCDWREARAEFQERLAARNPAFAADVVAFGPDGDAEIDAAGKDFAVPDCPVCGGIVKPDVVFFGESVPKARVARVVDAVGAAPALLVAGSSLMVFSGLRFVRLAHELGKPIAILNAGRTRGDELATLRLDGDCGEVLTDAATQLGNGIARQAG